MRRKMNCIEFGDDIASIYDKTRPFGIALKSKVLKSLSINIITKFKGKKVIRLLDSGTGTGRIAIPFADIYEAEARLHQDAPLIIMDCCDISLAMLIRLREKIINKKYQFVKIVPIEYDIRDLYKDSQNYDVVFAHWIFHVIYDWRVAVYAMDRSLKSTGLLLLFKEASDLYDAIDGNYLKALSDDRVYDLWSMYHILRRDKIRHDVPSGAVSSARLRLGSLVVDDRVEQMFKILGWRDGHYEDIVDKWRDSIYFWDIINDVIGGRSFTNMRLFDDESVYNDIAEKLRVCFREQGVSEKLRWEIDCSFSAKIFTKNKSIKNTIVHSVLLDVFKDTIGRAYMRKSQLDLDIQALWKKGFACAWNRMHSDMKNKKPFSGLRLLSKNVMLVYANGPFIGIDEMDEKSVYVSENEIGGVGVVDEIWDGLVNGVEVHDPVEILFEEEDSINKKKIDRRGQVFPYVHQLSVSYDVITKLRTLIDVCSDELKDCLTNMLHYEPFKQLIRDARESGILPYIDNENYSVKFISAVKCLVCFGGVSSVYIMAFPIGQSYVSGEKDVMGLLICSKAQIPDDSLRYLWTIADVFFSEYIEEMIIRKTLQKSNELGDDSNLIMAEKENKDEITLAETQDSTKNDHKKNLVFISYSHKDDKFLKRLQIHLNALKYEGVDFDVWDDTKIPAGERWYDEIKRSLLRAKVAVIMVSTDFLASDFVQKIELPLLFELAKGSELKILPIIVKPCKYESSVLSEIQSINNPQKPLSRHKEDEAEDEYIRLVDRIKELL